MKYVLLVSAAALLSGCLSTEARLTPVAEPQRWQASSANIPVVETPQLKGWWRGFNDPALTKLVEAAMNGSPDRAIAQARVLEARGLRRSAKGSLFPGLSASVAGGRQDTPETGTGGFYEAGFNATYEFDLFGRNKAAADASDAAVSSLEAAYEDVSLTLIAEIARTYIEFRAAEKQALIARKNLDVQEQTLQLVQQQKDIGEAPQLDVERSQGLVNTTRAEIPEFLRLADNARLRLGVLTGYMPEEVLPIVSQASPSEVIDIKPVLMTPADVIAKRPDIRAAAENFKAQSHLSDAAIANLFPTLGVGAFFGVQDATLIDPTRVWTIALSTAVTLLDFGRIRGQIDAAQAQEVQAYEFWRKTVLQAVSDVETALSDYARINERRLLLEQAAGNADQSLSLSSRLYKEGEVSFLDVLDAQRTLNNAQSAVISAEAAQSISLISLYKSLGVY